MPDNLIQVGATFDGSQLQAGVASATASIDANLQEMSAGFETHAGRSREALGGLKLAMEDAGVTVNRHVASMLAGLPGLGQAFAIAFPVVAIISFADSIEKASEKLEEHRKKAEQAASQTLDLALSFEKQAESSQVANLKLEDEIATLQKKPTQNGIAIAAMEGQQAVAGLLKSLQEAVNKENELLNAERQGFFNKLLYGDSGINDIVDQAVKFQDQISETTTKLRLAQAEGNKQQTAEYQQELNQQITDYKSFLNQQIGANESARSAAVKAAKQEYQTAKDAQDAAIAGGYAFAVEIESAADRAKDVNVQFDKTDQTLRELLLQYTSFTKAQQQIGQHTALAGMVDDAKKAAEALKQLTELNKNFFEMQQQEVKANATEAEKADKEAIAGIDRKVKAMVKGLAIARAVTDDFYKDQIELDKLALNDAIQNIELRFTQGKITQQQEIAEIAKAKEQELQLEKLAQEQRFAVWHGDEKEQAKIQAEINKIIAQSHSIEVKSVTDSAKAMEQQYRQVFSQIGSAITSNTLDMLKGTETVAQGFQKMYQSIISGLAGMIAQKAEKKAEEWAIETLFGAKKAAANVAQATSNTAVAGTEALASVPWPFNIAAASETEAIGNGLVAEAGVAFFAAGTNFVPQDGLAMLHRGEQIIPASKQGSGFSGGGGRSSFSVNYNVSAIDAEGVKNFLNTNAKAHVDMLMKQAKRRGWKP